MRPLGTGAGTPKRRRAGIPDVEGEPRPPQETVRKTCCACRKLFYAESRYVFRCASCRSMGEHMTDWLA